jgi:glycerophosphoryl diester phosphodiesterase
MEIKNQFKTVVMAHRGGSWHPDNSMANFRSALENNVQGIETDVWISKDGVPMIVHGGNDGQLCLYDLPNDYVYEWTQEDLQTKFKLENGEPMPTLHDVLTLYKGS